MNLPVKSTFWLDKSNGITTPPTETSRVFKLGLEFALLRVITIVYGLNFWLAGTVAPVPSTNEAYSDIASTVNVLAPIAKASKVPYLNEDNVTFNPLTLTFWLALAAVTFKYAFCVENATLPFV